MRTFSSVMPHVAAALASVALVGISGHHASAASPAYCALYAREYAAARITSAATDNALSARQRLEDQAFSRCLNLDVEPEFPATSVYYGQANEDVIGVMADVAEGDASFDDETPASEPAAPVVAAKPLPQRNKPAKTSEHPVASATQGTPLRAANGDPVFASAASSTASEPMVVVNTHDAAWSAWCRSHYPNSFDPKTGTVLPLNSKTRVACPH